MDMKDRFTIRFGEGDAPRGLNRRVADDRG